MERPHRSVTAGRPYPLGATYDGIGTNFSIFSQIATKVELCLFDASGHESRIELPDETAYIHHGYLPGIGPGQLYGYRVYGPWRPSQGLRCNPDKLLLDPYGKAVYGALRWQRSVFGHQLGDESRPSRSDSAGAMPKNVVISPYFDWGNDRPPNTPWHKTSVYEMHVKGFTARHPAVPQELRGTYAGLALDPVIEHLLSLKVTAIELQPVHQFVHEQHLVERGLSNYWGYNSISYLAPHAAYSAGGSMGQQVQEFKELVRRMHEAGIEVLLDVVYNHTAEGSHLGPTLSFRGIDNPGYYRLVPDDLRLYVDYTGTGNTLNVRHPHVLQLLMDSLRYWVTEMHVDGFRFDLAATLARTLHEVDRLSAFFDIIQQDPVISQVKLIAEPWDVGEGGYQVGNFPPLWSEWNGRYRDSVRDFWRGTDETLPEVASRLTGSSDLYERTGRRPWASINFVTAHDGFTLADLVSYNEKHNEMNGEENRDGADDNRSWNCGVEGPTEDQTILAIRSRQQRNMLATLFLSQGVPMLLSGDEIGRTQRGNNNAYCQDNEISWLDWENTDSSLLAFTRRCSELRANYPVLRRRHWFQGRPLQGKGVSDIAWFAPDGAEMAGEDWEVSFARTIGVFLNGHGLAGPQGVDGPGQHLLLLLNAYWEELEFVLPPEHFASRWKVLLDTACDAEPFICPGIEEAKAGAPIRIVGRSAIVLTDS